MANETATKSKRFYCVSLVPDICKTPIGPSTPPIPYSVIGEFADATGASPNVKSLSEPVILHQRSVIPTVKGGEPGTAGGIKSGTYGKRVETKTASATLRANGIATVQEGCEVWMNNRNTIGKIYERGGRPPRTRLQQIDAWLGEQVAATTESARNALKPLAQRYKDEVSGSLHQFGSDAMSKGGKVSAGSVVVGGAGVVVGATGVGLPVAAAMEAGAAAGEVVGTAVITAGGVAETSATVLDQAADFVLTGKTPAIGQALAATGTKLLEGAVMARLGRAGQWALQKFPSAGKLLKDKAKPGKKSDRPPPSRPPDKPLGGKSKGAKKESKSDKPSSCCPKNAAPGGKPVSGRKPVHFGTGEEVLYQTDFVLEGATPFAWSRCYRSGSEHQDWSLLGARWASPYTSSLLQVAAGIVYVDESGRGLRLPPLAVGEAYDNRKEAFTLGRTSAEEFILTWRDGSRDIFVLDPHDRTSWLPHGYDGINAMSAPGDAVLAQRFSLRRSEGRDGQGLSIEKFADAVPGGLLLRVRIDDGRTLEAMRLDHAAPTASDGLRIGRVEEVRPNGGRIRHVSYSYESETAVPGFPPVDNGVAIPARFNLVSQINIVGNGRRYAYRNHLLRSITNYNGFTYNLSWVSLAALRERWSGSALDRRELHERFPITPGNSYQARAIATAGADGSDALYLDYPNGDTTLVTNALGDTLQYKFDANWLAVEVLRIRPEGSSISLGRRDWDRDGMLLAEIDATGHATRYSYDSAGNVVAVTDALGNRTVIEYDAGNQPVAIVDAIGNSTRHGYDAQGRLLWTVDALGNTTRYCYDQQGRLIRLIDAKGGSNEFTYDDASRLVCRGDCSGYETSYRYDANHRLSTVIDELNHEVRYQYDQLGRLLSLTREDGARESFAYDVEGNVLAYTDANGACTRYVYNGHGMPVERVDALGQTLHYTYDLALQLVELVNENGDSYRFVYNEEGWLIAEIGFDGSTTSFTYDRAGQLTGVESAGRLTELLRDSVGQLLAKVTAEGTVRYAYDALGRLVAVAASHAEQRYRYDAVGRLIEERCAYYLVSPPERGVPERTADHGFTITHAYDELGNRIQTVLPNGRQVDTLRYGSGHWHGMLWQGASIVDVERDHLHRETTRHLGIGKERLIGSRRYDRQSRLAETTLRQRISAPDAHPLCERRFEYDRGGNLTHIHHGRHGGDDALGTLTYSYDPLGQLMSAAQPGLQEVFAFDPAGNLLDPGPEPTNMPWKQAAPAWQRPPATPPMPVIHNLLKRYKGTSYDFDARGNTVKRRSESASNVHMTAELDLCYDAENRLTRAVKTGDRSLHSAQYFYDAFSRRIAKRVIEQRWNDDQNSDTEPAAKTTHFVTLFVWDGDTMVQEVRQGDTVTYLYEPDSFVPLARIASAGGFALDEDAARAEAFEGCVRKSAGFHLARIGSWHLPSAIGDKDQQAAAALAESAAEERHSTAWQRAQADASEAAPKDRIDLYNCDHLGTPRELFDAQDQLVWMARYKAWGQVFEEKNRGVDQPLRFQGQYRDTETGLHYNRYRYYDPEAARYITPDPIGLLGGINCYSYAQNPTGWFDSLGLRSKCNKNPACDPCDGINPSAEARAWQGQDDYPGIDKYRNKVIKKGTVLYALTHSKQTTTPSYFTNDKSLATANWKTDKITDLLQVRSSLTVPGAYAPRNQVRKFIVNRDICVATGITAANGRYGSGGGHQFFVPESQKIGITSSNIISLR